MELPDSTWINYKFEFNGHEHLLKYPPPPELPLNQILKQGVTIFVKHEINHET